MNLSRRIAPVAVAIFALATFAAPVLAGAQGPVGDRIFFVPDQTYPAGTPFHIQGGILWFQREEAPALGIAGFTLDVDGVAQSPSYAVIGKNVAREGVISKSVGYNFPQGMTGTHTFTGTWWAGCGVPATAFYVCDGTPPNTPAVLQTTTISVTFTTD